MAYPKIGEPVFDHISGKVGIVTGTTAIKTDDGSYRLFTVAGLPDDPNYPGGRRLDVEISTSKRLMKNAG